MNERSASSNHRMLFIVGTDSTPSNRSTGVERTGIVGIDERLSQVQTPIITPTELEDRCCWGIWGQRTLDSNQTQQPPANGTLLVYGKCLPGADGSLQSSSCWSTTSAKIDFQALILVVSQLLPMCQVFIYVCLFTLFIPLYLTYFSVKKKKFKLTFFAIQFNKPYVSMGVCENQHRILSLRCSLQGPLTA